MVRDVIYGVIEIKAIFFFKNFSQIRAIIQITIELICHILSGLKIQIRNIICFRLPHRWFNKSNKLHWWAFFPRSVTSLHFEEGNVLISINFNNSNNQLSKTKLCEINNYIVKDTLH